MTSNYNRTILDVFNNTCQEYPNSPAFTCLNHTLNFSEIDALAGRFAAYVQHHTTLKPGDRIVVQLPNILQYPVIVFGALRAGLIIVNANPLYTASELKHQICDADAKMLVVVANFASVAAEIVEQTNVEQVVVTQIADLHSPLKRTLINFALKYIKRSVPAFSFKSSIGLNKALAKSMEPWALHNASSDDIAMLQYTGGTTGISKGVMLTHKNLVANMMQVNLRMNDCFRENVDIFVAPLPLYHIYAFTIHCMSSLGLGNHNILIPNPRDIPAFVKALKPFQFTCFTGLNTLFNALCRNEDFKRLDFSKLQVTASGGMALTADAAAQWEKITGTPVCEGYGLTETSPVVCINPRQNIQLGTVGPPLPDTEVKVINEEGRTLSSGEAGELCVRGPQVMKGYWQRPEATAKVLDAEGWLKTGDIAIITEAGYVKIVDRKKDMINVSGFKVFPNEVEDVLSNHPDVIEVAVVGVPDDESGEIVKAVVVSSNQALTEKTIRTYAKKYLTAYKVPRIVLFQDELPKNNVGKVLRRELK